MMDQAWTLPGSGTNAAVFLRRAAMLVVLCFALFLPGFFAIPPIDRDESRFAQATKQMVESGDYVDIRFQEEARHKKPVGIYWLQAAAVKASGQGAEASIWVYRLPSLFGATAAVVALAWAGAPLFGASVATLAAMLLASSILLGVEARLAKTDAMLLFTIVLAQGGLARAWMGAIKDRWRTPLLFWAAIGAGVLIKGPLILLVTGLAAAGLCIVRREAKWLSPLRPIPGALFAALLILPWFVAITIQTEGAFFREAVGRDLLGKVARGQESHGAPPGTYFVAFWVTFWPWAPLTALAMPWVRRNWSNPAVLFCLAWVAPSWIVFELIPTKLPHYVLPLYPAIALLLAQAMEERTLRLGPLFSAPARIAVPLVGALIAVGGSGLLWVSEGRVSPAAIILSLGAIGCLIAGMRLLVGAEPVKAAPAVAAGVGLLYLAAFQLIFPALDRVWISSRLTAAAERADACAAASTGFHEPSLVFLLGTSTRLAGPQETVEFITAESCRVALVEKRREPAFLDQASAAGGEPVLLERIQGVNINGGRDLDIGLYRLREGGE